MDAPAVRRVVCILVLERASGESVNGYFMMISDFVACASLIPVRGGLEIGILAKLPPVS